MMMMNNNKENEDEMENIPLQVLIRKLNRQTKRIIELENEKAAYQKQDKIPPPPPPPPSTVSITTTTSSLEKKYQTLLKKYELQTKEVQELKSSIEHSKTAKRKNNYSRWENDFAIEKVALLEDFIKQFTNSSSSEDEKVQTLLSQLGQTQNESQELWKVLNETKKESTMWKQRAERVEGAFDELSSYLLNCQYTVGKEEFIVSNIRTELERNQRLQALALKAKKLLQIALEERDEIESLFQNDDYTQLSEVLLKFPNKQMHSGQIRYLTLLNEKLIRSQREMKQYQEQNELCKKLIESTIEKSSELLEIPKHKVTTFNSTYEGVIILSKLVLSQLK